jgi:hypothetical protein
VEEIFIEAYAPAKLPSEGHKVAFVCGVWDGNVDCAGAGEAVARVIIYVKGVWGAADFVIVFLGAAARGDRHGLAELGAQDEQFFSEAVSK